MAERTDLFLGHLQSRIMALIWAGPGNGMTVHEVHDLLNAQDRVKIAYTTVLTVLRNLAKRGVLKQQGGQGTHVRHRFIALQTKDACYEDAMRLLVQTTFAGDVEAAHRALEAIAHRLGKS